MRHLRVLLVVALAASFLLVTGCSQAAPAPAPTQVSQAPVATAKPAEPTKPASAPTSQEASKKIEYPTKGKSITLVVSWAAGGANDLSARVIAPLLEKELGVPVQVVNKAGAGGQVGLTEVALGKPDGYTFAIVPLPSSSILYLDPERKSAFQQKNLTPLVLQSQDPLGIAVKADSPIKSIKDLIEAAKANPEMIKVGTSGVLSVAHLGMLELQKVAGVKFGIIHFDGGAQEVTALMGGHIDAAPDLTGTLMPQIKSGNLRPIGVMDKQENKFMPGVPTLESQGYKLYFSSSRGWAAAGGTPQEIVDLVGAAMKKAILSEEHQKKMDEMGIVTRFLDTKEFTTYWNEVDAQVKPLMEMAKQEK